MEYLLKKDYLTFMKYTDMCNNDLVYQSSKQPDTDCVVGFGKCPEGGALGLFGAADSGVDEESCTIWRLWTEIIDEGMFT